MNSWTGKPCDRCGGKKGPKYSDRKHCGKCVIQVKKEQRASAHESAVCRRYGLEHGDYQRLYDFQGGHCAICQRATGKSRRLPVDHDHKTGAVRGLLCGPCNDMLGHSRDSVSFFYRAVCYLLLPPARQLFGTPTPATAADLGSVALSGGLDGQS